MIYAFGHKNPDTDSIISAIAVSKLKEGVIPARIGDINPETRFVLDSFKLPDPKIIVNSAENKYWLVDHNSEEQTIDGLDEDQILGIIDHHKFSRSVTKALNIHTEPLGCNCTILAKMLFAESINVDKNLAGAMLGAIMSDTVIFRSSTTTDEDKEVAGKLAEIAGIEDIEKFGFEVKRMACNLKSFNPEYEVEKDFKKFETGGINYGVGQIETVCLEDVQEAKSMVMEVLENKMEKENLHFIILMVTDIMKKGTELWVTGAPDFVEEAFGKLENDALWVDGMMSRKKQVIPQIDRVIENAVNV